MVITILGRDGSGKTSLSKALGRHFSGDGLTAVINTDLTMPTTIMDSGDVSLGNYLFSGGRHEATAYLHQDDQIQTLFYAGTTANDDLYSFEMYLNYHEKADDFLQACADDVDNIIIDLSGQRVDPFLRPALIRSNYIIVLCTCDREGVNYLYSIRRPLNDARQDEPNSVIFIPSKVMPYQDTSAFQAITECAARFTLPYNEDIIYANSSYTRFQSASTKQGRKWIDSVRKLYHFMKGGAHDG